MTKTDRIPPGKNAARSRPGKSPARVSQTLRRLQLLHSGKRRMTIVAGAQVYRHKAHPVEEEVNHDHD